MRLCAELVVWIGGMRGCLQIGCGLRGRGHAGLGACGYHLLSAIGTDGFRGLARGLGCFDRG